MKLFRIAPKYEGQVPPHNAMVIVGKKYDGNVGNYTRNGWHVMINLPFVTKHIPDFLDPRTFTTHPETCFWRFALICRRFRGYGRYKLLYSQVWCPVEYLNETKGN